MISFESPEGFRNLFGLATQEKSLGHGVYPITICI